MKQQPVNKESENFDLYPNNEAGAFDYLDNSIEPQQQPVKQISGMRTQGEWDFKQITKKQIIIGLKNYGTTDYRKDNQCGQTAELSEEDKANAAYIVEACNHFEEMKEALKELFEFLKWIPADTFTEDGQKNFKRILSKLKQ